MQFPDPNFRILPAKIRCQNPIIKHQSNEQIRIIGSLIGLAMGDAAGAFVEFRPHEYLVEHPVHDLQGGGTWGLQLGQWTDDTSMALCLASSLLTRHGFDPYDQMVRYKWWYKKGFLSSTGECFDIGTNTRFALEEFSQRQNILKRHFRGATDEEIDAMSYEQVKHIPNFNVFCGKSDAAGNGGLMRLAPIPLFYFRDPKKAISSAGESARLTHADLRAIDACRYYAALIVAAIQGESKEKLLNERFYDEHQMWFGTSKLHDDVLRVARGSYKKSGGYQDGIRGKSFVINTLEAALWAFWSDNQSFVRGILNAINLGDDTDTTAAVYGQLAGAYYGTSMIPSEWTNQLYAKDFIVCVAEWLYIEGEQSRSYTNHQQQQQTTPQIASKGTTPQTASKGTTSQIASKRTTPQTAPKGTTLQTASKGTTPQQPLQQSPQRQSTTLQQNQHTDMPLLNQQNPKSKSIDYMGYDVSSAEKASASSGQYSTGNANHKDWQGRKGKERIDPATMPAAGVPSGFSKK